MNNRDKLKYVFVQIAKHCKVPYRIDKKIQRLILNFKKDLKIFYEWGMNRHMGLESDVKVQLVEKAQKGDNEACSNMSRFL